MKNHNVQPIISVTYPFKRIEAVSEEGEVRKLASLFCFLQNWWLTFYSKTIIIIEKIKENNYGIQILRWWTLNILQRQTRR